MARTEQDLNDQNQGRRENREQRNQANRERGQGDNRRTRERREQAPRGRRLSERLRSVVDRHPQETAAQRLQKAQEREAQLRIELQSLLDSSRREKAKADLREAEAEVARQMENARSAGVEVNEPGEAPRRPVVIRIPETFLGIVQRIEELEKTEDAAEIQELRQLEAERDAAVSRANLTREEETLRRYERDMQAGQYAQAQEAIMTALNQARDQEEDDVLSGEAKKRQAGIQHYFLKAQYKAIFEANIPQEVRDARLSEVEAIRRSIAMESSDDELSAANMRMQMLGMTIDRPRQRGGNESQDAYVAYCMDWATKKIERIDRADISPTDMQWFREYNELLQALRQLPPEVRGWIGGWKQNYLANYIYDSSGGPENMRDAQKDAEDAFENVVGGRDKKDNHYIAAVREALVELDGRHVEYMAPKRFTGESPARRRREIKDEIARQLAEKYHLSEDRSKLFVRMADRVWALTGLKSSRDRVVWKKTNGDYGGYGRDSEADARATTWGEKAAHEIYSYEGDGKFWWRRLFRAWEALGQEKTRNFFPQLADQVMYGANGGPHDFLTDFALKGSYEAQGKKGWDVKKNTPDWGLRKLTIDDIKNINWKDIETKYSVYIDQLVKSDATRKALIAPGGLLNDPTPKNLDELQKVLENVDNRWRDAMPRFVRGYLMAEMRQSLFQRFLPHFEKMEGSKIPHMRFYDSEINKVTGQRRITKDKWGIEDEIEYFKESGLIDKVEAEKMKREMCGVDLFWGLIKRKKHDDITGEDYYVPMFPAPGFVRRINRVVDHAWGYLFSGVTGFIGGFFGQFFKEMQGAAGAGGGGGGHK